jgi:hypothetical protein
MSALAETLRCEFYRGVCGHARCVHVAVVWQRRDVACPHDSVCSCYDVVPLCRLHMCQLPAQAGAETARIHARR